MIALVGDRAEPGVERVAQRALRVDRGRQIARLDPALRDAMIFVRGLRVALGGELDRLAFKNASAASG